MKYGDTLHQRSIPVWGNYNVDYNDIKHLIKVYTTKGQAQATAIPGKNNEAKALQKFEDELYHELREQHQRVDLFVQSKSGEIARRLVHLDRQIAQLRRRNASVGSERIPVRRLEKFSKLEEATLKAGEEVQSLSRFVGAQRVAFQKLLKKYKRWTGSAELGKRFQKEILDRPTSFSQQDFGLLLTQWTEVLAAVRAPFSAGVRWQAGPSPRRSSEGNRPERPRTSKLRMDETNGSPNVHDTTTSSTTSAAAIHRACESGSGVDVDTALAMWPLGRRGGKASYWIHPDNMIGLHVLLLQHTRLRNPVTSPHHTGSPANRAFSRRSSVNGRGPAAGNKPEDEIGVVICDDLPEFAKRQSAATIGDSENVPGSTAEKAAVSIRYTADGEAAVVIGLAETTKNSDVGKRPAVQKATVKKKALRDLFVPKPDSTLARQGSSSDGANTGLITTEAIHDLDSVRAWLSVHAEIRPLVQMQTKRTRFVGLGSDESGGVWATLDSDIWLKKCSSDAWNKGEDVLASHDGDKDGESNKFPHAVLEIRYEDDRAAKLITALDESHLTERIRGFSLEAHAVATLCNPPGMPRPYWLPALDHDIRKIPNQGQPSKRRGLHSQTSPQSTSHQATSVATTSTSDGPTSSGFSIPLGDSSATSAPDALDPSPRVLKKKQQRKFHPRTEHPLRNEIRKPPQTPHQRYWNEFDDGDEGSEPEAYTIFIDPNAPASFLGAGMISKFSKKLASGTKSVTEKIKPWLNPGRTPERQPLIADDDFSAPVSAEDDTDPDNSERPLTHAIPGRHRQYSTFAPTRSSRNARQPRESLLFGSSVASFAASFIVLLVVTTLAATARKKALATADLGVLVGVIVSLTFSLVAVGTTMARRDRLGWVHHATVAVLFVLDCLGCGVLIVGLGGR